MIYEFPSEEGDMGHLVSNEILWLKNRLSALKSCYSANRFLVAKVLVS